MILYDSLSRTPLNYITKLLNKLWKSDVNIENKKGITQEKETDRERVKNKMVHVWNMVNPAAYPCQHGEYNNNPVLLKVGSAV